jgi:hypothetical protein
MKKTSIPNATLTFISIGNTADQVRAMLEVRLTRWMPDDMRKVYERMIRDANKLEIMAEKHANIKYED